MFESFVEFIPQHIGVERLGDDVKGTMVMEGFFTVFGDMAGDDKGDHIGIAFAGDAQHFDAVLLGEGQIGEEEFEGLTLVEQVFGGLDRINGGDAVGFPVQHSSEKVQDLGVIVNDKNFMFKGVIDIELTGIPD